MRQPGQGAGRSVRLQAGPPVRTDDRVVSHAGRQVESIAGVPQSAYWKKFEKVLNAPECLAGGP